MLLAVALLAYPAAVFLLLERAGPLALTALFALVAGLRLLLARHLSTQSVTLGLLAIGALCIAAVLLRSILAVQLYPVGLSLAAALWCGYTLISPPSAIERLLAMANASRAKLPARLRQHIPLARSGESATSSGLVPPSAAQLIYMRRLTLVWLAFFLLNGSIATYTAFSTTTATWALYNGFISYLLVGLLLGVELLYRPIYQRRHGEGTDHGHG